MNLVKACMKFNQNSSDFPIAFVSPRFSKSLKIVHVSYLTLCYGLGKGHLLIWTTSESERCKGQKMTVHFEHSELHSLSNNKGNEDNFLILVSKQSSGTLVHIAGKADHMTCHLND